MVAHASAARAAANDAASAVAAAVRQDDFTVGMDAPFDTVGAVGGKRYMAHML